MCGCVGVCVYMRVCVSVQNSYVTVGIQLLKTMKRKANELSSSALRRTKTEVCSLCECGFKFSYFANHLFHLKNIICMITGLL